MAFVFSLLGPLLCVSFCQGLYFHIGETEQKCFIEEVPSETMIVGEFLPSKVLLADALCDDDVMDLCCAGKYKTQLFDNSQQQWLPSSPGIGMHVEVGILFKAHHTTCSI